MRKSPRTTHRGTAHHGTTPPRNDTARILKCGLLVGYLAYSELSNIPTTKEKLSSRDCISVLLGDFISTPLVFLFLPCRAYFLAPFSIFLILGNSFFVYYFPSYIYPFHILCTIHSNRSLSCYRYIRTYVYIYISA